MKKSVIFLNLILSAFIGLTITSCSSDDDVTSQQSDALVIKPAKTPEVAIYSGNKVLASNYALKAMTRAVVSSVGAFEYHKVTDGDFPEKYKSVKPATVTDGEKTFVKDYIKAHPDEASEAFYNINYFVQYAGSSYDTYTGLKDNNNASHDVTGSNQIDYIVINGNHINDYNAGGGPDALCLNLPLTNPAYHDSWGDVDNTKYNSYKVYKITYNGKEAYYLGFDYKTKKNSGEKFDGDGVFNDYVIKLTPADDTTYGNPDSGSGSGTTVSTGEVEANLSVNAQKSTGDYIATKLSIHVRDTTDVVVFIPATAEYYCKADDMNIVLSHKGAIEKYNDTNKTTMSYEIDGQTVTLTIAFELGGIRVTTSGINAKVLKYLRKTYGDGITFEVWNYYKEKVGDTSVTRDYLKSNFLDKSTVVFTADPAQYVNAFGALTDYTGKVYAKIDADGVWWPYVDSLLTTPLDKTYWTRSTDAKSAKYYILTSTKNAWDCTVTPTSTAYTIKDTDVYNQIYKK